MERPLIALLIGAALILTVAGLIQHQAIGVLWMWMGILIGLVAGAMAESDGRPPW